jgi:hypothetical protein
MDGGVYEPAADTRGVPEDLLNFCRKHQSAAFPAALGEPVAEGQLVDLRRRKRVALNELSDPFMSCGRVALVCPQEFVQVLGR